VVIASSLDAARAGMLRELLESEGIPARLLETMPGMPGAEVVVRGPDAERAREIARSAGFLEGPGEPVEIPDEEWSHGSIGSDGTVVIPEEESPRESVPVPARQAAAMVRVPRPLPWALALVALIAVALFFALSDSSLRRVLEAWLAKAGIKL
jgi:hypothetical protein